MAVVGRGANRAQVRRAGLQWQEGQVGPDTVSDSALVVGNVCLLQRPS